MTVAWSDETRAVEGRPDAQEESVALYTMHAPKGLEWPIVVPVNTMTQVRALESAVTDRASGRFYCPVFGVEPTGYSAARDAEKAELDRERVRLWYVAATRARELLVLPRFDVAPGNRLGDRLLTYRCPSYRQWCLMVFSQKPLLQMPQWRTGRRVERLRRKRLRSWRVTGESFGGRRAGTRVRTDLFFVRSHRKSW